MCGRFTFSDPPSLIARFSIVLNEADGIAPRFNVAPAQQILTVVEGPDGRALRWMRWGFQPPWFRPQPGRPPPINARAETLLERPMFRGALASHRCIIPADGFYEWKSMPGQRRKQPFYVRLVSHEPFGFAGLYTEGTGEGDNRGPASCVIITTGPNDLMAAIHQRMPVILKPEDEGRWLDPAEQDPVAVMDCLRPFPTELMEAFAVSQLVSSSSNDDPALIQPELPASSD